jgi:hypothetical protein
MHNASKRAGTLPATSILIMSYDLQHSHTSEIVARNTLLAANKQAIEGITGKITHMPFVQ